MFVIGIIVAMGVLNTILMSVLERVREFGVMRAVGLRSSQVRRLILLEGLTMGVIAVVIGDLFGVLLTIPMMVWGVDLSAVAGEKMNLGGVAVDMHAYAVMDWNRFVIFSVVAVIMTVLASLYPAWKASTLEPVKAINSL